MQYRFEKRYQQEIQTCDHPECELSGEFRAPKNRDNMDEEFFWFCKEHVRDYNKSWNYFEGMSGEEIEDWRHKANIWHRPTWNTKDGRLEQFTADSLRDDFEIFKTAGIHIDEETGRRRPTRDRNGNRMSGLSPEQRNALAELNLGWPVSRDDIRKRYRDLAKKLHPDVTGDDAKAEEQLKRINKAYAVLAGRKSEARENSPV